MNQVRSELNPDITGCLWIGEFELSFHEVFKESVRFSIPKKQLLNLLKKRQGSTEGLWVHLRMMIMEPSKPDS